MQARPHVWIVSLEQVAQSLYCQNKRAERKREREREREFVCVCVCFRRLNAGFCLQRVRWHQITLCSGDGSMPVPTTVVRAASHYSRISTEPYSTNAYHTTSGLTQCFSSMDSQHRVKLPSARASAHVPSWKLSSSCVEAFIHLLGAN